VKVGLKNRVFKKVSVTKMQLLKFRIVLGIGAFESMFLIVRGRMWLFPSTLGLDRESYKEPTNSSVYQRPPSVEGNIHEPFELIRYLKLCDFPEFRVVFRFVPKCLTT
jgi:hypothetical protein